MLGINLIKNLQALISVRVPLETIPTKGKLKFDCKNVLNSNCSNSSGNNNDNNNKNISITRIIKMMMIKVIVMIIIIKKFFDNNND